MESLYRSGRDDLRLINAEPEFVEELIDMQFRARTAGYGEAFPNAFYFVVEKLGERIGQITVDSGDAQDSGISSASAWARAM